MSDLGLLGFITDSLEREDKCIIDALSHAESLGLTSDNYYDPQIFANALCKLGLFAVTVQRGPQDFQMTIKNI